MTPNCPRGHPDFESLKAMLLQWTPRLAAVGLRVHVERAQLSPFITPSREEERLGEEALTFRGVLLLDGTPVAEVWGTDLMGHDTPAIRWLAPHREAETRATIDRIVTPAFLAEAGPVDGVPHDPSPDWRLGAAVQGSVYERVFLQRRKQSDVLSDGPLPGNAE